LRVSNYLPLEGGTMLSGQLADVNVTDLKKNITTHFGGSQFVRHSSRGSMTSGVRTL
jgi:hypothetical protein